MVRMVPLECGMLQSSDRGLNEEQLEERDKMECSNMSIGMD